MKNVRVLSAFLLLTLSLAASGEDAAVPSTLPLPVDAKAAPVTPFSPPSPEIPRPVRQSSYQSKSADAIRLEQKLAELSRLQTEIDELRAATHTWPQVHVGMQAIEVNLTKARQSGFDVSALLQSGIVDNAKNPGDAKPQSGTNNRDLSALLDMLQHNEFATILTRPELMVASGQPATIHVGGEFPFISPQSNGVEFRQYGTQVDVLAESLGNNKVRLHVRPRISRLNMSHAIVVNGTKVPGVDVRQCDFTSELSFGQSVVISGMVERDEARDGAQKGEPVEVATVFIVSADAVGGGPMQPNVPATARRENIFAPPTR